MEQHFDINLLALNSIRPKLSYVVNTIAALRTWVKWLWRALMTRFSILFMANYSEKIAHLKLQPCYNESKYQAHILPMKYDTKRRQGYPVCLISVFAAYS